jgi:hypothetical protein
MACSFAGRGGKLTSIQPPWTKYEVYAANVQIEIDLEPELDEILGITTAKEQIVIVEEAWERLRQSGKSSDDLYQLIRACDTDPELFAKQSGAASTAHLEFREHRPSAIEAHTARDRDTDIRHPSDTLTRGFFHIL